MKKSKLIVTLILAGMATIAAAQSSNPQGDGQEGPGNGGQGGSNIGPGMGPGSGQHPHGPPPQAIAACKDKASGAECSFIGRENKTRTGTCFAPPGGNHPLACRPDRGEKGMEEQGVGGQKSGGQSGPVMDGQVGGY
ncbi:MAG: hypothetical protein WCA63_10465 [Gallionella sp.]